ncbi:MAG: hypothetical protein CEE40_05200 [Chloroflexi bacterium B3_Chlor]|nr:MAG: hypothetical protein CEE40_05200 [Chloroflexi bacterium B3_Chlor]
MPQENRTTAKSRKYLSQSDVPRTSLDQALRIPKAIANNYAFDDTPPLKVAQAMNLEPSSSYFRILCGAAIAYGLTHGGASAKLIQVQPLATRILTPLEEGDDSRARREALLTPRIVGEFLRKYEGSPLPREHIAVNVLVDMGVPRDRAKDALSLILEGAESVGFLADIKGKRYVDLSAVEHPPEIEQPPGAAPPSKPSTVVEEQPIVDESPQPSPDDKPIFAARKKRVFVAHGKEKGLVGPIKKLLSFGELEAVVAADRQTVSQPVPDKVMNDMRMCGAAIIHVKEDMTLINTDAEEHKVLNPNVLIEIGAAMALYGRRFILLVREGISLPSNVEGLYEVRYTGGTLDGDATIRLLEAINDIKTHTLPGEEPDQSL